jgi:hypothetical protein
MERVCGNEWRLRCWTRACVCGRVCGVSMFGIMVCECVRMVWECADVLYLGIPCALVKLME